ncbi:MAG: hypothetical protein ACI4II_10195 [Acutalibacteraceae bacterium]
MIFDNEYYQMAYQRQLIQYYADKLLGGRSNMDELSTMLENDSRRYSHFLNDENEAKTR